MKVAVLGVGGVGGSLALHLHRDDRISSLLLIDKISGRTRILEGKRGLVSVDRKHMNMGNPNAAKMAIRGCDVVVNTCPPKYNLSIMKTALEAGAHYLDVAGAGPRRPRGPPGILEQLGLHDAFREAGLSALLSMGLDPGMTNVMARGCADALDAVDSIRIRSGGTLRLAGDHALHRVIPPYSRDAFLSDLLLRPMTWSDGRLVERQLLSDEEDFLFPPPIGVQRSFLVSHEEVLTLPKFLGKPVLRVDFKYAVNPHLALALRSLEKMGFLQANRTVRLGNRRVPFREALGAALPEPLELKRLYRRLEGTKCVSVDVEGTKGGARVVQHAHIAMDHEEVTRHARTTAVYYLTGAAASIGVVLLGKHAVPGPGVYPPEALNPDLVLSEWRGRNLPFSKSERVLAS